MWDALQAVVPVFLVIALGRWFKAIQMPGEDFWPQAEKITYYCFLPLLFFVTIARGDFSAVRDMKGLLLVVGLGMIGTCLLAMLANRWFLKLKGKGFACLIQGSVRFNNYVGIPVVLGAYGEEGLLVYAAIIALSIPLSSAITVAGMSHYASHQPVKAKKLFVSILTNPLILGSLGGLLVNLLQLPLPMLMDSLTMLAQASVALGLLTVGVGMDLPVLLRERRAVLLTVFFKQGVHPLLVYVLGRWIGLDPLTHGVATLYAALPIAASSFVLARQFGADARLMAAMIVATTLAAVFALTAVITFLS